MKKFALTAVVLSVILAETGIEAHDVNLSMEVEYADLELNITPKSNKISVVVEADDQGYHPKTNVKMVGAVSHGAATIPENTIPIVFTIGKPFSAKTVLSFTSSNNSVNTTTFQFKNSGKKTGGVYSEDYEGPEFIPYQIQKLTTVAGYSYSSSSLVPNNKSTSPVLVQSDGLNDTLPLAFRAGSELAYCIAFSASGDNIVAGSSKLTPGEVYTDTLTFTFSIP